MSAIVRYFNTGNRYNTLISWNAAGGLVIGSYLGAIAKQGQKEPIEFGSRVFSSILGGVAGGVIGALNGFLFGVPVLVAGTVHVLNRADRQARRSCGCGRPPIEE